MVCVMLVLFRQQYCWKFMGTVSLSYTESTVSRHMSSTIFLPDRAFFFINSYSPSSVGWLLHSSLSWPSGFYPLRQTPCSSPLCGIWVPFSYSYEDVSHIRLAFIPLPFKKRKEKTLHYSEKIAALSIVTFWVNGDLKFNVWIWGGVGTFKPLID